MAGSSLPVCWRRPNLEFPRGRYDIVEACCLVRGGVSFGLGGDGWHAMEAVQCLLERRHGGETGVTTVRYLEGPAVWKARDQGAFSQNLMDAAASYTRIRQGVSLEQAVGVGPDGDDKPALVLVQYRDWPETRNVADPRGYFTRSNRFDIILACYQYYHNRAISLVRVEDTARGDTRM